MNMIRIQLDLPEERVRELDEIMREAHIGTRKELFNSALTFLAWALNEREQGRVIASLDETTGGYKELVMPFFKFRRNRPGDENNNNHHEHQDQGATFPAEATTADVGRREHFGRPRNRTAGILQPATLSKGKR